MTDTLTTCSGCDTQVDIDHDVFYGSEHNGGTYCPDCYRQDLQNASTVLLAGPDYPRNPDGPIRITVGDWFIEDQYGDPWTDLKIERTYVNTSAWRGYYETSIDGWSDVLSGWTTGGWGDPTADRKRPFNEWAESIFTGDTEPPVNVAIVTDPTSNLFSTAIGVWVRLEDIEAFNRWVGDEQQVLQDALG